MKQQIERITFKDELPQSFFTISKNIYSKLPFEPEEVRSVVEKIFLMEAGAIEIILYTDHKNIRLVGMFPQNIAAAYFGWWETTDNYKLNEEAFKLLEADAVTKQRTSIFGPVNFNTFHNYRLRVGAIPQWVVFDREPINPPYYPSIIERLGYTTHATFESRLIPKQNIPDVYVEKQLFLDEVKKIPFHFIPINAATWLEYEDDLYELIHAIFSQNPFYKAISKEEFRLLYNKRFAQKLCPHSSVIFKEKKTGRLAAVSLCHPNYSTLKIPEDSSPDFIRDFTNLEKKILLAKSVGVHPDFRKQGLMNFLGAYGMLSFREYYDEVIFCTMRSDNFSLHFTDGLVYEKAEYALYHKHLI